MFLPDGQPLTLDEDALPDVAAEGRLVFWLPGQRSNNFEQWDRVSAVIGAEFIADRGIRLIPAVLTPTRRWVGRPFGRLLHRLREPRADRTLSLPDGRSVEQYGPRCRDLVLAWANDRDTPLDASQIRQRWPQAAMLRPIGSALFLVAGVSAGPPVSGLGSTEQDTPLDLAERALIAARAAGDPGREAAALADLGLSYLREGHRERSLKVLQEAHDAAVRVGDLALQHCALIDLGSAWLDIGNAAEARSVLTQALDRIRGTDDRYAEKLASHRLGKACSILGDHASALAGLKRAIELASDLGDHSHEADLLWEFAIQCADLGLGAQATSAAQESVDRMRRLRQPQAEWYAYHLANFRDRVQPKPLGTITSRGNLAPRPAGAAIAPHTTTTSAIPAQPEIDPGLLRMVFTAAGSMAKFLGSGFETTDMEVFRNRTRTCGTCDQHTGLRCRVCGCFTAIKARIGHERCPIGRWSR